MKKNLTNSPVASVSTTGANVIDLVNFVTLRESLMRGVHKTNLILGGHLTQDEVEDIVQDRLLFFIEKCQQGIYDISRSTPAQYLISNRGVWGPIQKMVKIKLAKKQLPEQFSAYDIDDEEETSVLGSNVYSINQPDVFRGETENQLLKVILELSGRDRKVIRHLIAGTPREDMALDLGLSQNTLNKLIFDVRKRLRTKLVAKNKPILAA